MQVVCEATQCPDTRVSNFMTLKIQSNVYMFTVSWFVVCVFNPVWCVQVRVAALQNLVKIMSLYYQYMETYMGPALFAVRHQHTDQPHTTRLDFMFISLLMLSTSLKFFIYTCIQRMSVFTVTETCIS